MSEPFLGEIRMVGFSFAPVGWSFCNGNLLAISQNDALFSLLGTTYGGDGVTTFALPNLQSRFPVHQGNQGGTSYVQGQSAGEEKHTLIASETAAHTHQVKATSADGDSQSPDGKLPAPWSTFQYSSQGVSGQMSAAMILPDGSGGQPHENMPPFTVVNFIIALEGLWPSQG